MKAPEAVQPQAPLDREALRRDVERLKPWFHDMDLGGVRTAPDHFLHDYPDKKWRRFAHAVPADLSGKSVLDIGCNAGFYSIEMKARGADRVLGIDVEDRYLEQARFAAGVKGVAVEFDKLSVYDVATLRERFDLVLFMGMLYHLRHPLLALDLIHDHVAKDLLVYQSMQRGAAEIEAVAVDYDFFDEDHFDRPGYPKLHFIEDRYAGDVTNWWAPNAACSAAMLRSAGFDILDRPEREVFICRSARRASGAGAVYPAAAETAGGVA